MSLYQQAHLVVSKSAVPPVTAVEAADYGRVEWKSGLQTLTLSAYEPEAFEQLAATLMIVAADMRKAAELEPGAGIPDVFEYGTGRPAVRA